VPVRLTVAGVEETDVMKVRVPLKLAAALGLNCTVMFELCPAARLAGKVGEVTAKFWLELVTLLTVSDAVPVLVAVSVSDLLPPDTTLPKARVVLPSEKALDCCWLVFGPSLKPWQPTRVAMAARSKAALATFQLRVRESGQKTFLRETGLSDFRGRLIPNSFRLS
jgi:hypothetical protein